MKEKIQEIFNDNRELLPLLFQKVSFFDTADPYQMQKRLTIKKYGTEKFRATSPHKPTSKILSDDL